MKRSNRSTLVLIVGGGVAAFAAAGLLARPSGATVADTTCPADVKLDRATRVGHDPVMSTMRKRALLLIMRSYASAACSSGIVSIIGRTPVSALKASVSCESIEVPDA